MWFIWRGCRYHHFEKGMEVFIKYMSSVDTDEDGYQYNVKKPDYLSYTGNLCVAVPDGKYALLIWPKAVKGYRYGVQIQKDNEIYSIMLNEDLKAKNVVYSDMVEEYKEDILELKERANSKWNID